MLAAVLCGGKGRRFGGDKVRARLGGRLLVSYPLAAADGAGLDSVLVGGDVGLAIELGVPHLPDAVGFAGPAGGLVAALRHASAGARGGVVLLGADMPLVPPLLIARLVALGTSAGAPALAVESPPNRLQPLGAYYASACLSAVVRAAQGPHRSLHGVFRAIGGVAIPAAHVELEGVDLERAFTNVNTVGDLAAAEELLG